MLSNVPTTGYQIAAPGAGARADAASAAVPLKVLLVAGDESDYALIRNLIVDAGAGGFELSRAVAYRDALELIKTCGPDVCLIDYRLGEHDAVELLRETLSCGRRIPTILLTEEDNLDLDLEAMKAGAADHLIKGQLNRLLLQRTIRYAVERANTLEALRASENKFRQIVETADEGIWMIDSATRVTYCNQRLAEMFGYSVEEMHGRPMLEFADAEARTQAERNFERRRQGIAEQLEFRFTRKDGTDLWTLVSTKPLQGPGGEFVGALALVSDITERKRAEERLHKSEERYRAFVEQSTEAVWCFELDEPMPVALSEEEQFEFFHAHAYLAECNNVMAQMYGFSEADEIIGARLGDLMPRTEPQTEEFLRHFIQSGYRVTDLESREIDRHGQLRYFLNNLVGLTEGGFVRRAWGTQRDVTEHKRAEDALRESEERYRELVENARDIIYSHDLKGNYTSVNKAGERILGYSCEEALRMNLVETIAPECRERAAQMLARKLAGEEVTAYDLEVLAKDGRRVAVEVNTRLVYKDGVAVGVQGIARDTTERKRAEEMVREADRRAVEEYARLLDRLASLALAFGTARDLPTIYRSLRDFSLALTPSFALVICMYDETREVREAAYIYGSGVELDTASVTPVPVRSGPAGRAIKSGEVVTSNNYMQDLSGRQPLILATDENSDLPQSALVAPMTIMGRAIGTIEVQSHTLGAYTQEHATAMRMAASLAASAIENVRLLNLEREKEEQLRQSQKMESIGMLAGGVAHDFNNLLTAIQGNTQLAQRRVAPDDPIRLRLAEIERAAQRAAKLTRQLLAFSRRQHLERRTINVKDSIDEMMKMLRRIIGEDVDVRVAEGAGLPLVYADPAQIEQVVMNLVVNARDAMPGGGHLTIETHTAVLDEAYCARHSYVRPGRYVEIRVSDTGTGMDAETVKRIFEPFFTTKAVGKGTGLGLSMVYGIVKQHDGHVNVYSEPGQGTTFKVYLPVAAGAAAAEADAAEPLPLRGGTETILVAEDEESLRSLARDVLEGLGYKVLLAKDGAEAAEAYAAARGGVDLLLFDLVMPRLGGQGAYERIRAGGSGTPVIFMTGYSIDTVQDRFVQLDGVIEKYGATLIQKPYTMEGLGSKVREVLDAARQP